MRQGEAVLVHDPAGLRWRRRRIGTLALATSGDERQGLLDADEVAPAAPGHHHRPLPRARGLPAPARRRGPAALFGAGGRPDRKVVLLPLCCAWKRVNGSFQYICNTSYMASCSVIVVGGRFCAVCVAYRACPRGRGCRGCGRRR